MLADQHYNSCCLRPWKQPKIDLFTTDNSCIIKRVFVLTQKKHKLGKELESVRPQTYILPGVLLHWLSDHLLRPTPRISDAKPRSSLLERESATINASRNLATIPQEPEGCRGWAYHVALPCGCHSGGGREKASARRWTVCLLVVRGEGGKPRKKNACFLPGISLGLDIKELNYLLRVF